MLIIGLGNPGADYNDTRHNLGANWIAGLAKYLNLAFKLHAKLAANVALANQDILAIPITYMNESGVSVKKLIDFYKLSAHQLVVVHDELKLKNGALNLKIGGGHGGHNGLRSIIQHLGTNDFIRIRIGIDHPNIKEQVAAYVLSRPAANEISVLQKNFAASYGIWKSLSAGDWLAVNKLLGEINHGI